MNTNDIFLEIHDGIPRQGPGDDVSTKRAFSELTALPSEPSILDVGSGPGAQTIVLANLSGGFVTALDTYRPYLDEVERRAKEADLGSRIATTLGSMDALPFPKESFDLIWAEGAIYIMGFQNGLMEWRPFLKREGYVAVTHISWLETHIPEEVRAFWTQEYPAITSIENNLHIIEESGYTYIDHFTLPESSWWDEYYTPLEARLQMLREKYADNKAYLAAIESEQREIDVYKKYSEYYGYVFYSMQKSESKGGIAL